MIGYGNSMFLATHGILAKGNAGTPPVNTVAPVISGTQVVGSSLSSTTGTWTGSPTPTFTYQWYRGATLISGATSSTYTLVQADAGNTSNITCQVTGTNGIGSATATSNTLAQIFDFDANAFITSASITDSTQKAATNKLTIDLKGYSIWTKMKALYPFVGGTSSTHKYNLKDPRDLDAAFRLVFIGGGTHSSTGYKPNGVNSYADTKFNPVTNSLAYNDNHLSYYSRTQGTTAFDIYEMGSGSISAGGTSLFLRRNTDIAAYDSANAAANRLSASPITDGRGFYVGSSINTNVGYFYKNGSQIATKNPLTNSSMQGYNYYIGGFNEQNTNYYISQKECAFSSIGEGLNTTELANFYTAVQAFQVALARNV